MERIGNIKFRTFFLMIRIFKLSTAATVHTQMGHQKCVIIHFGLFLNNWKKTDEEDAFGPQMRSLSNYSDLGIQMVKKKKKMWTYIHSAYLNIYLYMYMMNTINECKLSSHLTSLIAGHCQWQPRCLLRNTKSIATKVIWGTELRFNTHFQSKYHIKMKEKSWNESKQNARIRKKKWQWKEARKKKREYHKKRTSGKMKQGSNSKLKKALTALLTNYLQTKRQLKTDEE